MRPLDSGRTAPTVLASLLLAAFFGIGVEGLHAQTPSPGIELSFDSARVEALFAGSDRAAASELFARAVTVTGEGEVGGDVVLLAYRLRDGRTVAEYRSDPFPVGAGLLGDNGAVPEGRFFEGFAEVERSGLSESMSASPASEGIGDPVGFVVRNALGGPLDRYTREVIYAIAIPADASLREEVSARPVVVFGAEAVALGASTTAEGGGGADSDPEEALRQSFESEQRCTGWVRDYTVYTRTPEGMVVPQYFVAHDGGPECRAVPMTTYMDSMYLHAGMPAPRIPPEMAMGYRMLGEGLEQGMADEGFPLPVSILMEPLALFAEEASEVEPEKLMQDDVAARRAAEEEFIERVRFVGLETFNGRQALHYRADGLEKWLGSTDGMSWELTAASRWFDFESNYFLGDRWEINVMSGDQDDGMIAIEKIVEAYSYYPELGRFPRRQIMRIIGLTERMSAEDQAKIDEALAEIEKVRDQMEELPPAMRGMMQAQIDRLEAMSGQGDGPSVAEAVIDYLHVAVNEGPPYPGGLGAAVIPTEIGTFDGSTMVTANWTRMGGPENQPIFVPTELSMHGVKGGREGSLDFRVGNLEEADPDALEGWAEARWQEMNTPVVLYGTVRGSVRNADGESREVAPTPAFLAIERLSPTEATGFLISGSISGGFRAGHMYCSTAPRALDVDLGAGFVEKFVSVGDQLDQTATTGECSPDGN